MKYRPIENDSYYSQFKKMRWGCNHSRLFPKDCAPLLAWTFEYLENGVENCTEIFESDGIPGAINHYA